MYLHRYSYSIHKYHVAMNNITMEIFKWKQLQQSNYLITIHHDKVNLSLSAPCKYIRDWIHNSVLNHTIIWKWVVDFTSRPLCSRGETSDTCSIGGGGPGELSRYSDSLRARLPVGGGGVKFFAPVQKGPGADPASCTMGTGSVSRGKAAGAWRWPPTPL
jgi:hypothetical protein